MSEVFTFLIKTQPTIHDFETTQVKEIMSQQKFASADNKYQLNIFYVAIFISLPQHLIGFIHANLVNFEVYLKVPVSLDKMVKV